GSNVVSFTPRPPLFTSGHPDDVCAVRGRWRTLMNAGQHCWKACGCQPSRVRISHPPPCWPAETPVVAAAGLALLSGACLIFWLSFGSIFELQPAACRELRSLLCLVTGVPNRREQKGARRRSL